MLARVSIAVSLILLIASCTPKYNPANTPFECIIPSKKMTCENSKKGITSPGETVKLFGEPTRKNISDQGERYVYGYLGDTPVCKLPTVVNSGQFPVPSCHMGTLNG